MEGNQVKRAKKRRVRGGKISLSLPLYLVTSGLIHFDIGVGDTGMRHNEKWYSIRKNQNILLKLHA